MKNAANQVTAPSADNSRTARALLIVLSVVAGSTDAIGYLGLDGLFTAHNTGNLVLVAAHLVAGGEVSLAQVLAVPVFFVMAGLTVPLASGLKSIGLDSLRPLLLLEFLLLAGFFAAGIATGPLGGPNAAIAIVAGMLGVSAMAVQNALVQFSFKGAPPTSMMTGNVARLAMDAGQMLIAGSSFDGAEARKRAMRTLSVMAGFAVGAGIGAASEATFGLRSLALPTCLALLAFAMGRTESQESILPAIKWPTGVRKAMRSSEA